MKKNIFIVILIVGLALTLNFFNVKACPIFILFKVPCPGCGLTRAVSLILKGQIVASLEYNILPIPLLFTIITYILFYSFNKEVLQKLVKKFNTLIIIITIVVTIIVWIININNPLLY